MKINDMTKTVTIKVWETTQALRYAKYYLKDKLSEWTFDMEGEIIKGEDIFSYGVLPEIPAVALSARSRKPIK